MDSAQVQGTLPELWEERHLDDGSHHRIYKRYFTPDQLAHEIGGQTVMSGRWFVVARAALTDRD